MPEDSEQSSSLNEWHERSFFLEVKPRTDLASLFVDCPPKISAENKENADIDLVRVGSHSVEIGLPTNLVANLPAIGGTIPDEVQHFSAKIADISLSPASVCTPKWADSNRLFMCKVHAEAENIPLVPKNFHRLARDMCNADYLEDFCEMLVEPTTPPPQGGTLSKGGSSKRNRKSASQSPEKRDKTVHITCRKCGMKLVQEGKKLALEYLPTDDWLQTSASGDFFCRDSCGAKCDPNRHGGGHSSKGVESTKVNPDWVPTENKTLISHLTLTVHKQSLNEKSYELNGQIVICAGCRSEIGQPVKNYPDLLALHHAIVSTAIGNKDFIEFRFNDYSMFLAQLILISCENQSSVKLVIRSLDKTPYLLIWLLESYVVLATGMLHEKAPNENEEAVRPFPAIKMLYKVFDAATAASDPRANGEDASVGLIDVPFGCCLQMTEALLKSSHCLPPACRSVGQFYVGFLKIANSI
ncbi:hypothetical protein WR25_04697 isoform A [Diploscapter pachys]|uniref:E3 ubiquitin-protein ligase E3D n=2 Tax=Diploscapter pachys TaxID=2018661 RepID=A0A2A2J6Z1_9BILA|nr:hypothetical protein WR25_04697 isoform A [Diploscapter pachys]